MKTLMFMLALGLLVGAFALPHAYATSMAHAEPEIQLGKIKVTGEKRVIQVLEAIKLALAQPESSDPKLQNVVVCRITNDIGSHANQVLTCATNRSLATRRRITQLGFLTPIPAGGGEQARVNVLNEYLLAMPDAILQEPVNGPAFRKLLATLPPPTKDVYVYETPAPATGSHR